MIELRQNTYHAFVVGKLAEAWEMEPTAVVEFLVMAWTSDHSEHVADAGASIHDWKGLSRPGGMEALEELTERLRRPQGASQGGP